MKEEQIFLLLDGLDELGLTLQRQCIAAINRFLETQNYPYAVVCCRREKYETGQTELHQLRGAVYLRPLNDQQVQTYLRDLNRYSLWENVEDTPEFLNLARQPLFLTMFVVAYQGRTINNASDLFNAYIQKQLKEPNSQGSYPPGKTPSQSTTLHYLNWLANQMERLEETEYLIEEMQFNWLSPKRQHSSKVLLVLLFGLVFGLPFGLLVGLVGWLGVALMVGQLSSGLSGGLILGMIVSLFFGLIGGLIGGLSGDIKTKDQLTWSAQKGLPIGLISSLLLGILSGSLWFPNGFGAGLVGGLLGGLRSMSLAEKTFPNQGIRRSRQNGLLIILSFGLLFGLGSGLITVLSSVLSDNLGLALGAGLSIGVLLGLCFGPTVGLTFGLVFGLSTAIKHYTLRYFLAQEGSFPWDCVRFLDHAANLRFIQRVGGRYRFTHDLLRKHFAYGELPEYPTQ